MGRVTSAVAVVTGGRCIGHGLGLASAATAVLRATLPIRRVVGPADVAALAVHTLIGTALTGATCDIDGGQHFVC